MTILTIAYTLYHLNPLVYYNNFMTSQKALSGILVSLLSEEILKNKVMGKMTVSIAIAGFSIIITFLL